MAVMLFVVGEFLLSVDISFLERKERKRFEIYKIMLVSIDFFVGVIAFDMCFRR